MSHTPELIATVIAECKAICAPPGSRVVAIKHIRSRLDMTLLESFDFLNLHVAKSSYAPTAAILALTEAAPVLLDVLKEAVLQIEYLHSKFKITGSGNAVLSRARAAIALATSGAK